jgi:hypothetical protein
MIAFDPAVVNPLEVKSLVQQELFKRGILWSGFHTLSFSHTEADIEYTLAAYRDVLPIIRNAVVEGSVRSLLQGEVVEPVFRRTGDFNMRPKKTATRQE